MNHSQNLVNRVKKALTLCSMDDLCLNYMPPMEGDRRELVFKIVVYRQVV